MCCWRRSHCKCYLYVFHTSICATVSELSWNSFNASVSRYTTRIRCSTDFTSYFNWSEHVQFGCFKKLFVRLLTVADSRTHFVCGSKLRKKKSFTFGSDSLLRDWNSMKTRPWPGRERSCFIGWENLKAQRLFSNQIAQSQPSKIIHQTPVSWLTSSLALFFFLKRHEHQQQSRGNHSRSGRKLLPIFRVYRGSTATYNESKDKAYLRAPKNQ